MRNLALVSLALIVVGTGSLQAQEARLLRFPAIHKDTIVFSYAGNLYTVLAQGGTARRLTGHDGYEMFARFSPDGRFVAFTGQYDGNTEVYVMPAEGGPPKRLTYTATLERDDVSDRMGPNNIVMGWTPDGKHIVFRSRMRDPNPFLGQLFLISPQGGLPKQVPLPRGGFCSYSPDGTKLAYNRVFREFRTWKRYRGGMADDIWIHDFQTKKTVNITNNDAQDIIPMWSGTKIYYLSDQDASKRMNLFVHDTTTGQNRQLTRFTDFDIKFPSIGPGGVVFEKGGWIYRFDLEYEKSTRVPIFIREDLAGGRTELHSVAKEVHSFEISPDGKRALFSARGDIFTVPAREGPTRNLTGTPGVHDRDPKWAPDGKNIAYISDASGEDEIWLAPPNGTGTARQLTTGGDTYKYALSWSPDSKKILWSDKKLRLQYVDVASGKVTVAVQAKVWEIRDPVWSPDSKWIAFSQQEETRLGRIYLYSLEKNQTWPITIDWFTSYSPAFSADGKYLFFASDRDFNPVYSKTEWNHAYLDMARLYLVTLAKDTPNPFRPKSDEAALESDVKPDKDKEIKKKPEPVSVKVDIDSIEDRVTPLKLPVATFYDNLTSVGNILYYNRRSSKEKPGLFLFDLAKQKETRLGDFAGYEISADQKKMLVKQGDKYAIIDLPKAPVTPSEFVDVSHMEVQLDHHKEWQQIFHECWRQMRDYFYDPGMHGVDWKAMRDKYEPLVAHVNHRADLTYIIGEMISELNTGHCYVGGGEQPKVRRIPLGLLGAELRQDEKTRYYQVVKILKGANWSPTLRSPLTEIGVNIKEGDYILAVNGRPTNEMANIYETLIGTAGQQIRLKVNAQPKEKGSREVVIVPLADEQPLYYFNWVHANIKKVSDATGGKVGYIHIPDMQKEGLNAFVQLYYPQMRKKALIIDVRGNGGGNVSPQIIERLRRELAMMKVARNTTASPDPLAGFYGPKVCLINEFSASDGDLFPYRFKRYKLGKLIGKRTWGGVIGIRGSLPLLDGGVLMKPEFATFAAEGKEWIIEGHGVDPDIVIDNDPVHEYAGTDDQLNRAIAIVLEELRGGEWQLPAVPPYPKR
jgi:tricorn protease